MSNNGKKIYDVFVHWEMYGYDEVEAESLDEAIAIAEDRHSERPLPSADYVEDSFKVDYEATEDRNG